MNTVPAWKESREAILRRTVNIPLGRRHMASKNVKAFHNDIMEFIQLAAVRHDVLNVVQRVSLDIHIDPDFRVDESDPVSEKFLFSPAFMRDNT